MSEFDLSGIQLDDNRSTDFRKISTAIARLAARRKSAIELDGPLAQSKLAWKVATYQQAILYRVVALLRGTRDAWNARNILTSLLALRAFVETIAVFDELEETLSTHIENENLEHIDKVLMNRTFATRDAELLQGHSELQAINVLTFVSKLEKRYGLPIRNNYDTLSERCHPNSAGHHQMYSTTDYTDGTVAFSETKNLERVVDLVRAPLGLVYLFERSMDKLDRIILTIAEIQHRLNPVKRT